jgi:hypothetical protein
MRVSKESTITVNQSESRVYFSAKLVREYDLMNERFIIDGSKIIHSQQGYTLRTYRSAYYVKSKALVEQLANSFGKGAGTIKIKFTNGTLQKPRPIEDERSEWLNYLLTDFPGRIKTMRFLMLQKKFAQI